MRFFLCFCFGILASLVDCQFLHSQLLPEPQATPLELRCPSTNATSALGRGRGVPAFIVLRGQRFGGSFGDPIGAGRGYDTGRGGGIPFFPNPINSPELGGGVSPQTAREYRRMLGPFKAGVPTIATIIAEIVDEFGTVVTNANATTASLVVWNNRFSSYDNPNMPYDGLIPQMVVDLNTAYENAVMVSSINGRLEWINVQFNSPASTTLTLTVRTDVGFATSPRYNIASTLATCQCPVPITLQGGFPYIVSIATQAVSLDSSLVLIPRAQGPFAVPGVVAGIPPQGQAFTRALGGYDGSVSTIVIGEKVRFPHRGKGTYPAIAMLVRDRFGNAASFSTTVTLSLAGGNPPVGKLTTPLMGNIVESVVSWGQGYLGQESFSSTSASLAQIATNVALFNDFTVLGATTNSCALVATVPDCGDPYIYGAIEGGRCSLCTFNFWQQQIPMNKNNTSELHCSPGNTSAIVSLMPNRAMAIAPVVIQDPYNRNLPNRMPSQMVIGTSNNADPRTWFALQAVDEFGNRVDRGPYAYNGGEARISFASPEQGFPANNDGTFQFTLNTTATSRQDPFVKPNTQQYAARGTNARAVNGLYVFNNFTPLGPVSREANDVVLTFEDTALKGVRAPINPGFGSRPAFQPAPPITTATTTFTMPTSVRLSGGNVFTPQQNLYVVCSPNPLLGGENVVNVYCRFNAALGGNHTTVRVEVFTLQGSSVLSLEEVCLGGECHIAAPVSGLSSGAYVVRVRAGMEQQSRMIKLLR